MPSILAVSTTLPLHGRSPARRALVLHDRPLVVGLITLALGHGSFVVRAASRLAEAEAILAEWSPDLSVVDMDHDDSAALLKLLGASNTLEQSRSPVLGLTRRNSLKSKLRAFDLGVDDILTMPFSPEELLARSIVIGQARRLAPLSAASAQSGARAHPPPRDGASPSVSIPGIVGQAGVSRAG